MSIDKLSWILSVVSRLFSSFMTNSRKILNRVGDSRHPCLRPIFTANHSGNCPSMTTAHSVSLYRDCIIRFFSGSIPIVIIIFNRAFPHTVSKVALKSMKLKCSGTSTVPRPSLKPNWLSPVASSVFSLSRILLNTFPGIEKSEIVAQIEFIALHVHGGD